MPKVIRKETKQERVIFEGLKVSDFLDKKFLKRLEEIGLKADVINLILIIKENEKGNYPLLLGHESNKNLGEKILYIDSPTKDVPENFIKLLEEMDNE